MLVFPVAAQFQREVEFDGAGTGAVVCTAAAVPAFLGMQDDRRIALLRMRNINIDLACFDADVASVTDLRIEFHRIIRRRDIGKSKNFFL